MHKQDNTNRDTGLDSIMESMYNAAAKEPLNDEAKECPKCGKVHPINASCGSAHEAIDDEDTGRIPHDVDSFKGPDDQDNTSYQVPAELDAAVSGPGRDGDFIEYLNTIEWTDQGAADLVEWINQYNTGASYDREAY